MHQADIVMDLLRDQAPRSQENLLHETGFIPGSLTSVLSRLVSNGAVEKIGTNGTQPVYQYKQEVIGPLSNSSGGASERTRRVTDQMARILYELATGIQITPSDLASRVKCDLKEVGTRLRRLKDGGFVWVEQGVYEIAPGGYGELARLNEIRKSHNASSVGSDTAALLEAIIPRVSAMHNELELIEDMIANFSASQARVMGRG